ncbi:hypothetical protein [Microbacterium gilvum]|uniref:Uncharacterized protein n=1 Tax=Microbacterium gilvum TaxID=1336204 RepID=A0ABP9AQB1_9MICO
MTDGTVIRVSTVIRVGTELFRVDSRAAAHGRQTIDLTWLSGPAEGTYGFTVSGPPMTPEKVRTEAADFVAAFFADDGIGPSDFAEFMDARRSGGAHTP